MLYRSSCLTIKRGSFRRIEIFLAAYPMEPNVEKLISRYASKEWFGFFCNILYYFCFLCLDGQILGFSIFSVRDTPISISMKMFNRQQVGEANASIINASRISLHLASFPTNIQNIYFTMLNLLSKHFFQNGPSCDKMKQDISEKISQAYP